MRVWQRLAALFQHKQLDLELDEEIRAHLELTIDDYMRQGLTAVEARRLARVKFGSTEASKDAHRDSRGLPWIEGLAYDLRHALRSLLKDRSYTLTAVAILALSIGLNVMVFAVVDTILFRGNPLVKDNHRILYMQERYTLSNGCCLLYPDFLAWKNAKSFEDVALIGGGEEITLADGDVKRDVSATTVTANAFGLLGVRPARGRDFTAADEAPGAPQVLMLNHRAWVDQFAKRSDIVGHHVVVNHAPATIIGVMPEGFDFSTETLFWMPFHPTPGMLKGEPGGFFAFGRLAAGATHQDAATEIDTIGRRLENEFPATNKGVRAYVRPYSEAQFGPDVRRIYGSVWAAAWMVLLIACANLANLTLTRTLSRSHELSTRAVLGAGRGRLARQMFVEAALPSLVGAAIGWWLAQRGIQLWARTTYSQYVILDYSFTWANVWYAAGMGALATVLVAAIPIARTLRMDLNAALKSDTSRTTMSRRTRYVSAVLVGGQMALAIVLLAGAGVLARSLWNVVGADTGVRGADKVLVGRVSIPRDDFTSAESRNVFWDRLRASLSSIPGVDSVALAGTIPLGNPGLAPFDLEPVRTIGEKKPTVTMLRIGPGYLQTVGAQLVAGREFVDADGPLSPNVALVNASFAMKYWPGESPVGKRVGLPGRDSSTPWYTVVGVTSNIMQNRPLRDEFLPIVYVPQRQRPLNGTAVLVRTVVPPGPLAAQIRQTIEAAAPSVVLEDYSTLESTFSFDRDRMDLEHAELGKHAAVAPVIAVMALLLAAVGLFAVANHSVRRRSKEIAIRMALGSDAAQVRRMVFREGMTPVIAGWFLGMAASLAVNRVLESQLVGVKPNDPVTATVVTAALFVVAAAGCWAPARQASVIDPAQVLRQS